MNKKLISIAVAAAMAAPLAVSADTTLYGRINNSAVMTDLSVSATDADGNRISGSGDNWDVEDYASRLGVKGSEDLGNGMKGIYQIELQMETSDGGSTSRPVDSFGTRLGYVGVSSGWGTLAIGRQWTPYYGSVDKTDVFQLDQTNDAYMGAYRTGDAIAYVSPSMGGFSVAGAVIATRDLDMESKSFADAYNLSVDWNSGPFSVGASWYSNENTNNDQWGLAGSWKLGDMFAVIGQYEDGDIDGDALVSAQLATFAGVGQDAQDYLEDNLPSVGTADASSWAVVGQMFFGNNVVGLKYGERDADFGAGADWDLEEWVLSWEHHLSKRTRVFAVYDNTETNGSVPGVGKFSSDSDRFGLGVRHDF